jgi:hypothetical protein
MATSQADTELASQLDHRVISIWSASRRSDESRSPTCSSPARIASVICRRPPRRCRVADRFEAEPRPRPETDGCDPWWTGPTGGLGGISASGVDDTDMAGAADSRQVQQRVAGVGGEVEAMSWRTRRRARRASRSTEYAANADTRRSSERPRSAWPSVIRRPARRMPAPSTSRSPPTRHGWIR